MTTTQQPIDRAEADDDGDGECIPNARAVRDQPLDFNRCARSERARKLISECTSMLHLKVSGQAKHRRYHTRRVEAVISAVAYHHCREGQGRLMISLSKDVLGKRSRYRPDAINASLPPVVKALADVGLIDLHRGYRGFDAGHGKRSTIVAGPKLVAMIDQAELELADFGRAPDEEVIHLRGPKPRRGIAGKQLEYPESIQTRRWRDELRRVNAALEAADIACDLSGLPFDETTGVPLELTLDVSNRCARRVFTEGKFDSGGRLAGPFWHHLPKHGRLDRLRINGNAVAQLDFRSFSVSACYALAGKRMPVAHDPYLDTLKRLGFPGGDAQRYRQGIKSVVGAMMFAEKPMARFPRDIEGELPPVPFRDARVALLETLDPIKDYLECGRGHHVQFLESEVIMAAMLRLLSNNVIALHLHDALFVEVDHAKAGRAAMVRAFKEVIGRDAVVEVSSDRAG
jgi:hypothetical protein